MTQQYRLASMAAWLSSTGIPHHSLLSPVPLGLYLSVSSSPRPGVAAQSPCCSSQPLPLPGDPHRCPGCVWLSQDCLSLLPFRPPQISYFTLSLKCFSSDPDNCPDVGIGALLQFPHPPSSGPVQLTLLFSPQVPSSYWVLCGSIYSFPLVRSSCPLSPGVLQALLCLKVCSWWILEREMTPRPPTPPSCFPCCAS